MGRLAYPANVTLYNYVIFPKKLFIFFSLTENAYDSSSVICEKLAHSCCAIFTWTHIHLLFEQTTKVISIFKS